MKVLILAFKANSIINFRGNFIKSILDSGNKVVVMAPISADERQALNTFFNFQVELISINFTRGSTSLLTNLLSLIAIVKGINSTKPNKIFLYTWQSVVLGTFAAILCRIRYRYSLITGLGYFFEKGNKQSIFNSFVNLLLRSALMFSTKIIFQNIDDMNELKKKFKLNPIKLELVNGSGVDLNKFKYSETKRDPSFVFMGRFLVSKGILEFFFAAKKIKKIYPDIEFAIIGNIDEGNPQSIDMTKIDESCLEIGIKNFGEVQDPSIILKQYSIFVLPSYREGVPRSTLEAMAIGRAIISTDVPGCRETVEQGLNGYLVAPRSAEELFMAMLKFIENPSQIVEMGNESRKLVERKFDDKTVNKALINILNL